MKKIKLIFTGVSFLFFVVLILSYYFPYTSTEYSFGYNPNYSKYFGPTGAFESLSFVGGISFETDSLLLSIEFLATFIISIFISSMLFPVLPDEKLQNKTKAEYETVKAKLFLQDELIRNLPFILFLLFGVVIYVGLISRTSTFNKIEGLAIVFAFIYSAYNVFYFGLLIPFLNTVEQKLVLIRTKFYYDLVKYFFIFVNFLIFIICLYIIFFFCVKSFYQIDKFNLVALSTSQFHNPLFQNLSYYSVIFAIIYFVTDTLFLVSNKRMSLTQKLMQIQFLHETRPSIKENDSIENQKQAKRNIRTEKTKDAITLEIHTNLSQAYTVEDEEFIVSTKAISEDTKEIKKSNSNLNHSQSPDQKAKTIIFLSSYLLILPLAVSFGLFFAIEYLDKNGIKIPGLITKILWIPIAAIALWNLLSVYTFLKTTYLLIFEIPTEKPINTGKVSDFDYRLFIVLWLMFIVLIFFILALFLNYYL